MRLSEKIWSEFGITEKDFDCIGRLVDSFSSESVMSIRSNIIRWFGSSVTDRHFQAMYYHIGASRAARESEIFKLNITDLCQRVN